MRQIKFRAWDKKQNKWLSFDEDEGIEQDYTGLTNLGYWTMFLDYDQINIIVMQFTGLLDKNGKEIYEGDILGKKNTKLIPYVVSFQDGGFVIEFISQEDIDKPYYLGEVTGDILKNIEVIGNIYENKELLK